jgi:PAS domain S-box-containing protein
MLFYLFYTCLISFAVSACVLGVRYVRKLRAVNRKLQLEHSMASFLYANMSCCWCYWYEGDSFVQSSQKFKELFQLDPMASVHVHDVLGLFGESPFESFQRALNHLIDYGGEFTLQSMLKNATTVIEIHGQCLRVPSDGYAFEDDPSLDQGSPHRRIIVLIFNDVTMSAQEKLAQQTQQKERYVELELLRAIMNSVPMALWYRDAKGRIQYCNSVYANALETTAHRVIAENRELVENNAKHNTYALFQQAIDTGQSQVVRTHTVIAGQRRLMEISEIPLPERCTIGYALDVTEVEEVEDDFLNHRKAFHEVLDQISTPIAIYAADTRLTFFNQSYVKLFEFDESFLYSQPTLSEVLEDLRARRHLQEYRDFPAHKRERLSLFKNLFHPIHETIDQPDGRTLRIMITPYPLGGLLYIFDDITDKLTLERGYNTLMAVQRETLDHLYEGVLVFGSDNRLRLSNPAMGRIWHLSDEKREMGRHINDVLKDVSHLFHEQAESKVWRKRMTEIVSLRKPQKGSFSLRNDQVIDYTYVPLPDGSHMMSFVDASDRWRFEQSLKDRTAALEQADHLKSNFISHVSYELRSPLNTISGFSEILMNQYFGPLNERQLDYCGGIRESSEQLISLINDMIDLASIEAGTFNLQCQEISLEKFLTSVLALVHNRANDQGLEIRVENTCTQRTVFIDSRRLKHSLFNVLSTAIKFTPSGGRITLKVQTCADDERFFKMTVEDTSGDSSVAQNKYRTADLGFALVQKLVKLHGGTLRVDTTQEGSQVSCHLPMGEKQKKLGDDNGGMLNREGE